MRTNLVFLVLLVSATLAATSQDFAVEMKDLEFHVGLMPTYCEGNFASPDLWGAGIKNVHSQPVLLFETGFPLSTRVGFTFCPTALFLNFFIVPYFTYGWEWYNTTYGDAVCDYTEYGIFVTVDLGKWGLHFQLGTGSPSRLNIGVGASFPVFDL